MLLGRSKYSTFIFEYQLVTGYFVIVSNRDCYEKKLKIPLFKNQNSSEYVIFSSPF